MLNCGSGPKPCDCLERRHRGGGRRRAGAQRRRIHANQVDGFRYGAGKVFDDEISLRTLDNHREQQAHEGLLSRRHLHDATEIGVDRSQLAKLAGVENFSVAGNDAGINTSGIQNPKNTRGIVGSAKSDGASRNVIVKEFVPDHIEGHALREEQRVAAEVKPEFRSFGH